jgi:hypothetical protein
MSSRCLVVLHLDLLVVLTFNSLVVLHLDLLVLLPLKLLVVVEHPPLPAVLVV